MIENLQHYTAPLLDVFTKDVLRGNRKLLIEAAVSARKRYFDLGEDVGLAVDPISGPCIRHGIAVDYDAFLKAVMPFEKLKRKIGRDAELSKASAESAMVPDNKYWIKIALPAGIQNGEYGTYMRSSVETFGPIKVFCYRSKVLGGDSEKVIECIKRWFEQAVGGGFIGESLFVQTIGVKCISRKLERVGEVHGAEFALQEYRKGVTWPWIYLFLQLRAEFPLQGRFSIQFDKDSQ